MADLTAKMKRLREFILPLLRCPACGGGSLTLGEEVACPGCGKKYPLRHGAPVMLPDPAAADAFDAGVTVANRYTRQWLDLIDRAAGGPVLDLGSGNNPDAFPNVIKLEVFAFPEVDVVGQAEALPFVDGAFAVVMSGAVFEHLADPWQAAAEVGRILRPGGEAYVETAFLQPVHAYPAHYYNMTIAGVERLFGALRRIESGVRPWQYPGHVLGWTLSAWAGKLPPAVRERFLGCTFGDFLAEYRRDPHHRQWLEGFGPADLAELACGVYFHGCKAAAGPASDVSPLPTYTTAPDGSNVPGRPEPQAAPSTATEKAASELARLRGEVEHWRAEAEAWHDRAAVGEELHRRAAHSLAYRLGGPGRRLRRAFWGTRFTAADLRPGRGVCPGDAPGLWRAADAEARFLLPAHLATGRWRLQLKLAEVTERWNAPRLRFDHGGGFGCGSVWELPEPDATGEIVAEYDLPQPARAAALLAGAAGFRLAEFRLRS